ncbi:MAG: hypothetical protein OXC15_02470 [Rhodospirillaceae bacterium]|nr:hypothetical protein [Rhodospirillaceae bacterium]
MAECGDRPRQSVVERVGDGRRHVLLPSDLAGSLRRLGDGEFDRLLRAVAGEARRRGRAGAEDPAPPAVSGSGKTPQSAPAPAAGGRAKKRPLPVPPGQARLIRAAWEAGVKPAAIARQLRLSRAQVESVIGKPKRGRG